MFIQLYIDALVTSQFQLKNHIYMYIVQIPMTRKHMM